MRAPSPPRTILAPLTALVLAALAGSVIMLAIGVSPREVYVGLVRGTLGNATGIGEVLYRTTAFILTGLAVAIPFHAGLFNIGGEGQLMLGSLTTAVVAARCGPLPALPALLLALGAGASAGAVWGGLAGWLKARTGGHEVINTIMLNFIASGLTGYLVGRYLAEPGTLRTETISESARVAPLSKLIPALPASPANMSLFLALGLAVLGAAFLWRTHAGLELRAVGTNPLAARFAQLSETRTTILALAIGGACAALSGANTVLGNRYAYEQGLGAGNGVQGIAVALLARSHPIVMVPVAFLFAVLSYGGLVVNPIVPREIVQILQAFAVLALLMVSAPAGTRSALAARWLRFRRGGTRRARACSS